MEKHAIIVAGGKGLRLGRDIPKQFIPIAGKPILMHTIEAFFRVQDDIHIILSISDQFQQYWLELCHQHQFTIPHTIVDGGETRFHSVRNGLSKVSGGYTAVHDGARPLVSAELIKKTFKAAKQYAAVVPGISPSDSCRMTGGNSSNHAINRADIRLIQTPQVFESTLLKNAYEQPYQSCYTDDASVVESLHPITLIEGEPHNIKVTYSEDLYIAESIILRRKQHPEKKL